MPRLILDEFHRAHHARIGQIAGFEMVSGYRDVAAEYRFLTRTAGVVDLSFRGRLCLTGSDRVRFLHGQITNDVKKLQPMEGCYAALASAKGKMESDLNVFNLPDELLLDFEPGLSGAVVGRLERYIVADDVQVADVAPLYGLMSIQGPESAAVVAGLKLFDRIPNESFRCAPAAIHDQGEIYLMNRPRLASTGFDLFAPVDAMPSVARRLFDSSQALDGGLCGWEALEAARIEAGIPRYGVDMDASNFPAECGIDAQAVSYSKGCYIGQEVLNRIRTMGHVNRLLRGLRFGPGMDVVPAKSDAIVYSGKAVGFVTSAASSPATGIVTALAFTPAELEAGAEVHVRTASREFIARVFDLPFRQADKS